MTLKDWLLKLFEASWTNAPVGGAVEDEQWNKIIVLSAQTLSPTESIGVALVLRASQLGLIPPVVDDLEEILRGEKEVV